MNHKPLPIHTLCYIFPHFIFPFCLVIRIKRTNTVQNQIVRNVKKYRFLFMLSRRESLQTYLRVKGKYYFSKSLLSSIRLFANSSINFWVTFDANRTRCEEKYHKVEKMTFFCFSFNPMFCSFVPVPYYWKVKCGRKWSFIFTPPSCSSRIHRFSFFYCSKNCICLSAHIPYTW